MKLKTLIKDLPDVTVKGSKDIEITGISSHSKAVGHGNLFIAKKGFTVDGSEFISEAVGAGASAILTDLYNPFLDKKIIQIIHPNVTLIEAELASRFYQNPAEKLYIVGVTGTNGKTTTTFLMKHILENKGALCGLIGTIECSVGKNVFPSTLTTPDVIASHKLLRDMVASGCTSCVMEVTSHALDQERVGKIDYRIALFTNLTQDHLDYHSTMDEYAEAKALLFTSLRKESSAILNQDSPWCEKMVKNCQAKILKYSIDAPSDFKAEELNFTPQGTTWKMWIRGKKETVRSPLIGRFNVYNCLGAIAACLERGLPLSDILKKVASFKGVPGRLERVDTKHPLNIFVDYAHTPDALQNVLSTLKECCSGKLLLVFGCGGGRDRFKRSQMGLVAETWADFSIITNDNPRSEDPLLICKEILSGFKTHEACVVELDRKAAIHKALLRAEKNDIVLIAGKGHETYQIFAQQTIPFDDREVARELLREITTSAQ